MGGVRDVAPALTYGEVGATLGTLPPGPGLVSGGGLLDPLARAAQRRITRRYLRALE